MVFVRSIGMLNREFDENFVKWGKKMMKIVEGNIERIGSK